MTRQPRLKFTKPVREFSIADPEVHQVVDATVSKKRRGTTRHGRSTAAKSRAHPASSVLRYDELPASTPSFRQGGPPIWSGGGEPIGAATHRDAPRRLAALHARSVTVVCRADCTSGRPMGAPRVLERREALGGGKRRDGSRQSGGHRSDRSRFPHVRRPCSRSRDVQARRPTQPHRASRARRAGRPFPGRSLRRPPVRWSQAHRCRSARGPDSYS